jgi:hypothetical protein
VPSSVKIDSLPLSALNDYLYCARRAALKFIEGLRGENEHTLLGDSHTSTSTRLATSSAPAGNSFAHCRFSRIDSAFPEKPISSKFAAIPPPAVSPKPARSNTRKARNAASTMTRSSGSNRQDR